MFWIGLVYVLFATVIAFWIGRPIIWLSFNNEKFNAAFRYALVRLRDASEAVAFYRGELAERTGLRRLFAPVVANYKRYVNRMMGFYGWNLSISQIIVLPPYLLQFPRFFAGEIKLGAMSQSASAFGSIQDGLSFFRNAYDQFAGYRAAIIRLHGLVVANEEGRALPEVTTTPCVDGTVELDDVEVRTPDGKQLDQAARHAPGDRRHIGDHRPVGQREDHAAAQPGGIVAVLFGHADPAVRAQRDDVPVAAALRAAGRPARRGDVPGQGRHDRRRTLQHTLLKVALPHLVDRLDEVLDWAKVLSPGEQQRIAFARILLTKPKVVFCDEATSALDEGLEFICYKLVRTELPDTILVSVSHRTTVEQHHTHELELLGDGEWRLGRVRGEPSPSPCNAAPGNFPAWKRSRRP